MKKGFTLVELLGSIVILAIIALIAFPAVLNLLTSSQNKIDDGLKNYVEEAARSYVSDHVNDYPKDSSDRKIDVITLKNDGYISETNFENNKSIQSGCVKVSVKNNNYVFSFSKEECN